MSVPRALLLMLALLQATGMAEVLRRQSCEAECRNNGCDDDCTPGNDSPSCPCHCPSLQTRVPSPVAAVTMPAPTHAARPFDSDDGFPLSPDPREILHVPRRTT